MSILIDDLEVDVPGVDLGAVLTEANRQASESGRVIVEVHLDGETLVGERLTEKRGVPVSGSQIELYTTDTVGLVRMTLEEAKGLLGASRQIQIEAADQLQQDEPAPAMEKIGRVLGDWHKTLQAIQQSAELCGVNLSDRSFGGEPVIVLIEALGVQLKDLRDLVAANDGVGLADVLGHEMPETTDRWCELIDAMIGWVGEGAESGGDS